MVFDKKSDLELLRRAINSSLRIGSIVNMPDEDEARLIRILVDIEDELGLGVRKDGPPTAHEMVMVQELKGAAESIVRLAYPKEEIKK